MKVKLGELTKIRTGKLDANAASENGKYPFFTCSKEPLRISTYSYDCECVLVAGNGDLNVKYYNGKFDAYQRTYIIESNSNGRLHLPYLYYFMTRYIQELRKLSIGGVIKYIKLGNLTDAEISLPSIKEQKDACEKLKKVKDIIDKKEAQISYLDNLIKARFVEMFDDNFGEIVELGNVCDVRDGTHDSPKYHNAGYPLVTSKNICDGKIDFSTCNLIQKEDYVKINKRSKVDVGDVLMPMIGTVGNPIIVNTDKEFAIKNVALIKFKDDSVILNTFIKTLLESDYFGRAVLSKTKGGTQKFISLGDIRKLEFNLPPIELQHRFATFVAQIDKSKFAVQKSLEKTQLLFDSLMQEYFG
ncbi:restriction endonuclease subunit S [Candidatus Minimicrobia naudis]|uniref:Restriction endonuclease subunit S n=1 Tax=Candidatus Minimicrobia naudis TaxID=2841263 RepID=A0A8F1MC62_9BACT|nr:restriction endonuclease subunit S [Candidatus Minimicrobia naudis]